MSRPNIAEERGALLELINERVPPGGRRATSAHLRHVLAVRALDIQAGAIQPVEITVPRNRSLLLTYIGLESYPKDAGGNYLQGMRRQGASYDALTFQWSLNGVVRTQDADHRNWLGSVFQPFESGTVTLSVAYNDLSGSNDYAQRLYLTFHGYSILAGSGGVEALDTILAELSQQATAAPGTSGAVEA